MPLGGRSHGGKQTSRLESRSDREPTAFGLLYVDTLPVIQSR
jgi:hypothetical protein